MAVINAWQPTASPLPILQALEDGQLVALPTESTYEVVASALQSDAVARLQAFAGHDNVPAIVVSDETQVYHWMPLLRGVGMRLIRKLGPGPLIVRADGGHGRGLWSRLPERSRQSLVRDERVGLRGPAHPLWADLRAVDLPLVSVSLPAATAEQAAQLLGEQVACVVDGGPAEFATPPSVIEVNGRGYVLRREGGLTADLLHELALCRILFVCTGNTCRSPMAETLCAKLLADRLICPVGDLKQQGFLVQSAGVAAMMGNQASPDAVTTIGADGADLTSHRSKPVTMEMLAWADHLFVMAESHRQALMGIPIAGLAAVRLLSPNDDDIADPIGSGPAEYRACADQIIQCIHQRLPELLES